MPDRKPEGAGSPLERQRWVGHRVLMRDDAPLLSRAELLLLVVFGLCVVAGIVTLECWGSGRLAIPRNRIVTDAHRLTGTTLAVEGPGAEASAVP